MKPKDDFCVVCEKKIDVTVPHQIVWSKKDNGWKRIHNEEYNDYCWDRQHKPQRTT